MPILWIPVCTGMTEKVGNDMEDRELLHMEVDHGGSLNQYMARSFKQTEALLKSPTLARDGKVDSGGLYGRT